jgi:hypothetical protein
MNFSILTGRQNRLFAGLPKKTRFGIFVLLVFCLQVNSLRSQTCTSCCLSAFPVVTVYQTIQTGHGLGVGVEAGNWKKDAGKFSYFLGTNMVWGSQNLNSNIKGQTTSASQMLLTLYVKGQYKLTDHLYVVASPGIVNLSYFDLQTGLRYVIPVSKVVGIGIEPAYSFNQKVFLLNANLHIALH